MAVTPIFDPNLSGAYANIQNALSQGAEIASKTPGTMGAAAVAAAPLAEISKERQATLFKSAVEDHLARNKSQYAAQAEGKTLRTQDDLEELAKDYGVDPEKIKGMVGKEGVWTTPEQENDLLSKLGRSQIIEKAASQEKAPRKANLIRLLGRSNDPQADQWLARMAGVSKPLIKQDPATKINHLYDEMSGQDLGPVPGAMTPDSEAGVHLFNDAPSLRKVDQRQADALESAGKSAASDTSLKSTAKDLDDLEQLKKLLNSKNPSATINIRADLARDIGGVPGGRFSSILASTEGTDPSVAARLGNYMSMKFTGQMSDKVKQELVDQIDTTITGRKSQLASNLAQKHQSVKADAPYASDNLIATKLGYQQYLKPSEEDKKTVPEVKSQTDYDKLAKGDVYTFNGKTYTKK